MTHLIDHLERFLGLMQSGWTTDPDGNPMHFQIARFTPPELPGVTAFTTLGLSRHPLTASRSGKAIRLELLLLTEDGGTERWIPSLLQQTGEAAMENRSAPLRGDVLGPSGPVIPNTEMTAFYVTSPMYFADEFGTCNSDPSPTVIAWLVPISSREADFVARIGWEAFEDALVEQNPPATNWHRKSMKL